MNAMLMNGFNQYTTRVFYHLRKVFLLLFIASLTACGGGGGGDPDPNTGNTDENETIVLNFPSSLPYSGSMASSSTGEHYRITGLAQGQEYLMNLSTSNAITMHVYSDAEFSSSICDYVSTCSALPNASGDVYVKVTYSGVELNGASFTLNATATNFEGSPSNPVNISTLLPYTQTADEDLNGYYQITGLTAGNSYTVSASTATGASVSLYVYQAEFINLACSSIGYTFSTGSPESCTFNAAGTSIWVRVKGVVTGEFTLDITDNGLPSAMHTHASEGSIGNEVELTLGDYFLNAEVDYTASYYHVAGLEPNAQYRTVINWLDSDNVDLYVYTDNTYSTLGCSSTREDLTYSYEKCVSDASATGELWIKVDGSVAHQYLGEDYSIAVYAYYPNEGSSSDPVIINYSATTPQHSGTVDSFSYYELTGLAPNTSYVVDLINFSSSTTGMNMYLHWNSFTYFFEAGCETDYIYDAVNSLTCILQSGDDGTMTLKVEEEYDFTGQAFDIVITPSPVDAEGSVDAPVSLTFASADLPHSGTIGGAGGESYYVVNGLTSGEAYSITIDGAANGNDLYVYTDVANLGDTATYACKDTYYSPEVAVCTRRASSDSLWIMVNNGSATTYGEYTLTVTHSPYQSEGTLAAPVQLAIGNEYSGVIHDGNVSTDQSFYQITGLTVGESYVVALTNADSPDSGEIYIYDNTTTLGGTSYGDYVSHDYFEDGTARFYTATAVESSLWVMIDGIGTSHGSQYTLQVAREPVDEDLSGLTLADFPRTGSTDEEDTYNAAYSTYQVTGLTANQLYDVSLTNLTADVSLYAGACSAYESGLVDELCAAQADANGELIIQVTDSGTFFGAFYTIGISAGTVDEGSELTPAEISTLPYSGQVATTASYYRVSGLSASALYEVSLTNLTGSANLYVYDDDSTYSTSQCSSLEANTIDELCGGTSSAAGELYIKVTGSSGGAQFALNLTQGVASEGAPGAEVVLAYNSADLPHSGTVDKSASYYEITGLSGNTDYYFVIKSLTDDANISTHISSAYDNSNGFCSSTESGTTTDACVANTDNGGSVSHFVKVSGDTSLVGAEYILEVLPVPQSEGSLASPILLDYVDISVTPYDAQTGSFSDSYYQITGLTVNTQYTITINQWQRSDFVYFYNSEADMNYDTRISASCDYPTTTAVSTRVCTMTATETSIWIRMEGPYEGTYADIGIQ